ncbi:DM13 domain-containing protein [Priestia taiwanensis]|uniref:DM13 domain-containing protein n=1 Tax=Priestia taiwanensis TaxID=1347902 RepID=A0A917AW39_9BACI|nr:DM13 domain-containing protein [Priestia taiwanensis]MBM7364749.1 preprotein translocase subunit YajC [Priestia taiwanensis]GGE79314.1 hypothetical protein GCM10007140_31130 [Priestia taiwanensis]
MKRKYWMFIVLGIGGIAIAWWLLSPLFITKTVDEKAPVVAEIVQEEQVTTYAGMFVEVDNIHNITGNAKTVMADGKTYIRFEEFEVTNGPDLNVYVVKEGMDTSEGIDLGKLKGNKGNQNYEIPSDVDLMEYNKVVVWCRAFDVNFGHVVLEKQ